MLITEEKLTLFIISSYHANFWTRIIVSSICFDMATNNFPFELSAFRTNASTLAISLQINFFPNVVA